MTIPGEPSSDSNNNNKDVTLDGWVESISTMLGCVGNEYVKECSISIAPEHLGKSKMEAYRPKVISIGPLHRGTSPDLIYMEEIKWSCMLHLLHRTSEPQESLKSCSREVSNLDEIVRACYIVGDIKFNRDDLSKIILLDGCFLLELLICGSEELNTSLKCSLTSSPGADVGEREWVLSDLTVLGNQIPFIILVKLATLLFPDVFPLIKSRDKEEVAVKNISQYEVAVKNISQHKVTVKNISRYVLSLLGYKSGSRINEISVPGHVLELVQSFINLEMELEKSKDVSITMESDRGEDETTPLQPSKVKDGDKTQVKLMRCATRLEAAGVEINRPPMNNVVSNNPAAGVRFDLSIKFCQESRKLQIPPLHITKTTEVKWRNFIAWELNRSDNAKCPDSSKSGISCKFIWYALFFQGLICCVHDIQLLRDRNVIVVHEEGGKELMSNKDLLNFFRDITKGVRQDQIVKDSCFSELFLDLNSYTSAVNCTLRYSKIIFHLSRRVLTAIWYFCIEILFQDYLRTGWKVILAVSAIMNFMTTLLTCINTFFPNLFH